MKTRRRKHLEGKRNADPEAAAVEEAGVEVEVVVGAKVEDEVREVDLIAKMEDPRHGDPARAEKAN